MTEEHPGTGEQPETTPPPVETSPRAGGESMVWIGGLLVLGSYLVFELGSGEYSLFTTSLILALAVAVVARVFPTWLGQLAPRPVVVKTLGYLLALSGVFEVLGDVRFGRLDEPLPLLGALISYAGYVLGFLGARSIRS